MIELITVLDIVTIIAAFVNLIVGIWTWVKVDDVEDDVDELIER